MNIALWQGAIYKMYRLYILEERSMRATVSIGDALAWPFLLPGNLICRAVGVFKHHDLVRMLINSLFWTVSGVLVVVLAS
jgi:hypothetical protein